MPPAQRQVPGRRQESPPRRMSGSLAAFAALAALSLAPAAYADCTVTAGSLSFGSYDVFSSTALDSVATITYSCSAPAVSPTLSLSRGGAPTFSPRQLLQGTNALSYNLFLDAARTTIWGDGTGGTSTFACSLGTNLTASVYGRIFALQNVPAGSYSDSITATIVF